MKCINCNTNNNLKERNESLGQCKNCSHEFAFEPTEMPSIARFTDSFFAKTITSISDRDTLFFTQKQLYYLLDKKLRFRYRAAKANSIGYLVWGLLFILLLSIFNFSFLWISVDFIAVGLSLYNIFAVSVIAQTAISSKVDRHTRLDNVQALKIAAIVMLVFGTPLSIISKTFIGVIGSIGLGTISAWLSFDYKRRQSQIFDDFSIDLNDFNIWLDRWISINDAPERMLKSPKISTCQAILEPKVVAYKFDRVVVCDSPKIAQLLISNNFHFENNCAIVAIDRYPQDIFVSMKDMLDRIPDLKVFAFHDYSPQGLKMIPHLRSEKIWFPDLMIPIIDVSILPHQISNNIDIIIPKSVEYAEYSQQLPLDIRNSLDATDLALLDAGFYLELASFPPRKLIQILQRAIDNSYQSAEIEDSDMLSIDSHGYYTLESLG